MTRRICQSAVLFVVLIAAAVLFQAATLAAQEPSILTPQTNRWLSQQLTLPQEKQAVPESGRLEVLRNDYEPLQLNRSCIVTRLRLGDRWFDYGLGAHAHSHLRVVAPAPIQRFRAWVGVDNNDRTAGSGGSVRFSVHAADQPLFTSDVLTSHSSAVRLDLPVPAAAALELIVDSGEDGPSCDHADWCDASIVLQDGRTLRLDELPVRSEAITRPFPFSFRCDSISSDELLIDWPVTREQQELDDHRTQMVTTWTSPQQLVVRWETIRYDDFPALDWVLYFENKGSQESSLIEDVQVVDLLTDQRYTHPGSLQVHALCGGGPNPAHLYPLVHQLAGEDAQVTLSSGHGRSSQQNAPFWKIATESSSVVMGLEWSGTWRSEIALSRGSNQVSVRSGMQKTHFRLRPEEQVRSPRVVMVHWPGDTDEASATFRQLIYAHYCARRGDQPLLPVSFCNTCFTRGGGWLNETTADNQISLIRAYSALGLDALLTDAGWFEGGWPAGAGNWTPRKDNYPEGMGPVAQAAKDHQMIYGLWFEPERVMKGTQFHREHPEWCLSTGDENNPTLLANFALPEVQDHFFQIVAGFMQLPGFRIYRQDFNMDPLAYWQHDDAEERQGIAEIRYIEGLYAYWDRIRSTWPDALLEECASGGNRIDLGTVMRMHLHQKTDYWFDNEVDQTSLWGISQFLPNNTMVAHLRELDDYSFHSTMASSLCLGWIADAPEFDSARGKALLDRYRQVRHLLVGAWYPLLPCPTDFASPASEQEGYPWIWQAEDRARYLHPRREWCGSQFHRTDLDEGLLLVFRRQESPYAAATIRLRRLTPDGTYVIASERTGAQQRYTGAELMQGISVTLDTPHTSDMLLYRRE